MPVEIKELIIRAMVRKDDVISSGQSASQSAAQDVSEGQEEIVEACVRQVLQILKKSKER